MAATCRRSRRQPALLSRLRNGYKPDAEGVMTLVRWLGMEAERFLVDEAAEFSQQELMSELRRCFVLARTSMKMTSSTCKTSFGPPCAALPTEWTLTEDLTCRATGEMWVSRCR